MLPPSHGTAGSRGIWMEPGAWAASCSTSRSASEVTSSHFPDSSRDLSFFSPVHGAPWAVYGTPLPIGHIIPTQQEALSTAMLG